MYVFTAEADQAFRDKARPLRKFTGSWPKSTRCPRCGHVLVAGEWFGWVPSRWTESRWAPGHSWCWADYFDPIPWPGRSRTQLHHDRLQRESNGNC